MHEGAQGPTLDPRRHDANVVRGPKRIGIESNKRKDETMLKLAPDQCFATETLLAIKTDTAYLWVLYSPCLDWIHHRPLEAV
jgi:hypothetical protein